jgi:hypothetical protein
VTIFIHSSNITICMLLNILLYSNGYYNNHNSYKHILLCMCILLCTFYSICLINYEGQSVNRSQMDIKPKTCDIQTCKKALFLDISSININTLVPSLYLCTETRSKSFDCCLSHFCTWSGIICDF